ncbi:hypothetical protein G6F46_015148 [Rhizopus delemar]|nr:hypothetical protein G6F46_015148 [Rhizopus delemar]
MGAGPLAPLPSPAPIPDCATPAIAQNAASQSVACSGTWIHRLARCAQLHSLNSSSHADASPVGNECISVSASRGSMKLIPHEQTPRRSPSWNWANTIRPQCSQVLRSRSRCQGQASSEGN